LPPPTVSHPVDDALGAYALGKLDGRAASAVARHLAACAHCRGRVAALTTASFTPETAADAAGSGTVDQPRPTTASRVGTSPLAGLPNYRIERRLGEGGMGEVYLAHNILMDRPEVLKIVHKDLIDRPGAAERFLQEVRNAARLQHPNIVAAYYCLQSKETLVLAMEYVPGQNLAEHVRSAGPLPVAHACHYIRQAALGLQHAHEKHTIHRDIKPHNLMLARDGDRHIIKVLDFGLAKVTSEQARPGGLTSDGRMMGTPDYIAPEQINDAARADIRADIYSLGCTLYFFLTGRPPFAGAGLYEVLKAHHDSEAVPVHEVRPDVPPGLSAVIAKMMAKAPADRYQTPAEVAVAVHPFAQGEPVPPGPTMVPARPVEPSPASRSTAAALSNDGQTREATPPPTFVYVPPLPPPSRRISTAVVIGLAAFGLMSVGVLLAWVIGLFGPQPVGVILLPGFPEGGSVTIDNKPAKVDRDPATGVALVHIYVHTRFELVVRDRSGKVILKETYQLKKGEQHQVRVSPGPPPPIPDNRKNDSPDRTSDNSKHNSSALNGGGNGSLGGIDRVKRNPDKRDETRQKEKERDPVPPPPPPPIPALPAGFTPLFDGRTMAGWEEAVGWTVVGNTLVGRGADGPANLFTKQADFADFELWAEVKIEGGYGGLCFRARPTKEPGPVLGYKAQITARKKDEIPTGTLSLGGVPKSVPTLPRDLGDRFFVIHIRAVGSRITVHIDEHQAAGYDHPDTDPASGAIAFQLLDEGTVIRVRQIGIKVRSTRTPKPKASAKRQLFHAADLPGQEYAKGGWSWRAGEVTGHTIEKVATNWLFLYSTEKFRDFELEFEVRCSSVKTRTGVQIRSSPTDERAHGMTGPQVEVASVDILKRLGFVTFNPAPPRDVQPSWPVPANEVALREWKFPDWNRVVVRCVGSRLRVAANGHVLVDRDVPGLPAEGLIGLQQPYAFRETASATYRNVFITDLSGSK
jgi:serine/threonine protein kinase